VAKPFLEKLYQMVKGSGFVVLLLDHEACVIELIGDQDILDRHSNFRIGELWDEENKGTNAMGLVKIEEKPLQVFAAEHFSRMNHWITCSAAPIWGENGKMIGIFDVSGDHRFAHAHTLGMVVAAAQAIENQLRLESANAEIIRSYNNVNAIVQSMSEGVISFDENGRITRINPVALKILHIKSENYRDLLLVDLLKNSDIPAALLDEGHTINDQEIFLDTGHGQAHFLFSGQPIFDQRQEICGGVAILRETKKVHRLVNKIVGARAQFTFEDIIGKSEVLQKSIQLAKNVADSMSSIYLQGESGTGKEMFAQAIHNASPVINGPFVGINCAAIPRELIESELFGYEEGAFTGAMRGGRPGKFELANEGTIFLDEIGDMTLETQVSLLRVLQEKRVVRIGGFKPIPVTLRVIAATNRDLKEEVRRGNFREDLYYRLNVINIKVPPLRHRKGDVLLLADYFIHKLSPMLHLPPSKLDSEAAEALENYLWPGNVRELSNAIERAVNLAKGRAIIREHLPESLQSFSEPPEKAKSKGASMGELEKKLILETLEEVGGNITRCASALGISRNTLYRKLRKYHISIPSA
jgi:transcriptional regulator with PAS, ATPase and Fis domain